MRVEGEEAKEEEKEEEQKRRRGESGADDILKQCPSGIGSTKPAAAKARPCRAFASFQPESSAHAERPQSENTAGLVGKHEDLVAPYMSPGW